MGQLVTPFLLVSIYLCILISTRLRPCVDKNHVKENQTSETVISRGYKESLFRKLRKLPRPYSLQLY